MITRTVIIFLLIAGGLLAKKGGLLTKNKLRMVIDAGRGGKLSRFSVNVKKYVGDTLSLSCRVGSF